MNSFNKSEWRQILEFDNKRSQKNHWTQEEDTSLIQLVEENGAQKWTFIAEKLPGRTGKQCRERWHNHLNPKIKKFSWSTEEDWILYLVIYMLIQCHKVMGNKWAEMTKILIGRTDNAIKNHWNSSMKRKAKEYEKRLFEIKEGKIKNFCDEKV